MSAGKYLMIRLDRSGGGGGGGTARCFQIEFVYSLFFYIKDMCFSSVILIFLKMYPASSFFLFKKIS